MTNDYLFHGIIQESEYALKSLLCAVMHLHSEDIKDIIITNPIILGQEIGDKPFVLDVRMLMNNNTIIDLELQVINYHDWPERSLQYLCRCFDALTRGQKYIDSLAAIHIGILDYEVFPGECALVDNFRLYNSKNGKLYSDKFQLYIMTLPRRDDASEEDKQFHSDLWAQFFKARFWEELKMLAEKDKGIESAVNAPYILWNDDMVQQQILAREDYERRQRLVERQMRESEEAEKQARLEAAQARQETQQLREEMQQALKEMQQALKENEELRHRLAKYEQIT